MDLSTEMISVVSSVAIAGISGIVGFVRTFRFVREGELGAKLRFGRFRRVVHPGFVVLIPFVEELTKMHVRISTIGLPEQVVTLKDKLSFRVSAVVLYKVTDIYKALFNIDSLRTVAIDNAAQSVLRSSLSGLTYEQVTNFEDVAEALVKALRVYTENWGIEIDHFAIVDFEPTPETSEVLTHLAKVGQQIEGNKLLVASLLASVDDLSKLTGPMGSIATALILRGGSTSALVGDAHRNARMWEDDGSGTDGAPQNEGVA